MHDQRRIDMPRPALDYGFDQIVCKLRKSTDGFVPGIASYSVAAGERSRGWRPWQYPR